MIATRWNWATIGVPSALDDHAHRWLIDESVPALWRDSDVNWRH